MPPRLQMRKQSLAPGKSHLAGHKAEQGLNMGQEWGEGRGWRWPHSSQVRRLVQVWHMKSRTKLGTVRMAEKNQFDKWQSKRGSKTASQTQLWMKTKVGREWFKNSNGLCGLAQEPDHHSCHYMEKLYSEQGIFYPTSGAPSPQSWEPLALLTMLSHVLRCVISKQCVATFVPLIGLSQLIPPPPSALLVIVRGG